MDKTLHTAASGLNAQQRYVEIISNNIANVNTTGYKTVRPEFQDMLYETLRPAGAINHNGTEPLNEVQIGSGVELVGTAKNFRQGDVTESVRELDLAINGDGFFIVQLPDGSQAFTRDGTFSLNNVGEIINSQGYRLDPGISVPDDAVEIQISKNGTIQILRENEVTAETIGQIELARFVNPGGLRAMGENIYIQSPASGSPIFEEPGTNNTGQILQKYLEGSNVSIVEEMVNMISAQRAYELNSKSVQTADTILGSAVNLKRQ
ncbi:MAG: flagellar basal-body rod protein FlgG [Ignavibacteria bacterium]|jgi:flagellar basal-body rod protein FlgG|nr:flagellar basal-body rod protein FlgG [Ignavibacteria bacterium]